LSAIADFRAFLVNIPRREIIGEIMFGLFGKKKPATAMDALIRTLYGDPPPPQRAKLDQAIMLAHMELLSSLIAKAEVTEVAMALNDGPIPYSTHDLAVSVALNFFKQPERIQQLNEAQLVARLQVLTWLEEHKVAPLLAQSFENTLYELYKP
jgi:hypothetical protein